jgi:hypothetical protein
VEIEVNPTAHSYKSRKDDQNSIEKIRARISKRLSPLDAKVIYHFTGAVLSMIGMIYFLSHRERGF